MFCIGLLLDSGPFAFLSKYDFAHAPTIAATIAVPIPPKTSCQFCVMNSISSTPILSSTIMPEDKPVAKQEISAGDGSHNYQAVRDVNVHHHSELPPPSSLITKVTNEQIVRYEPNVQKVLSSIVGTARVEFPEFKASSRILLKSVISFIILLLMSCLLLWKLFF
jgi:hypothetical protein